MRIAVVGTTGSGKTTLASRLADAMNAPLIELDSLNWQGDWRGLHERDPDAFVTRVCDAAAAEAWVCDGNYRQVRDAVLRRATHLIWLDYPKAVVIRRVIGRSLARSLFRRKLWAGNRERWRGWIEPGHPVRWAWATWERNRSTYENLIVSEATAHLIIVRLTHPREARGLPKRLGLGSD